MIESCDIVALANVHRSYSYYTKSRVYRHNRMSAVPVEFHRNLAHAQTVETRPFSPLRLRPGNEASLACALQ